VGPEPRECGIAVRAPGLTFKSYALLYKYREGDPAGLDGLRANDPALKSVLGRTVRSAIRSLRRGIPDHGEAEEP